MQDGFSSQFTENGWREEGILQRKRHQQGKGSCGVAQFASFSMEGVEDHLSLAIYVLGCSHSSSPQLQTTY